MIKNLINKIKNKKRLTYILASIVLIIFIGTAIFSPKDRAGITIDSAEKRNWKVYENKNFGFSIEFPVGWKIHESVNTDYPSINIYRQEFRKTPPFDPFSGVTQISIFPKGLPTELPVGQIKDSELEFKLDTIKKVDYKLTNDQIWATYVNLEKLNRNWSKDGFIWIETKIDNRENSCTRNNSPISFEECNPYGGDIFEISGKTNDGLRRAQNQILETFKIIK
jgi:hypothetical protein